MIAQQIYTQNVHHAQFACINLDFNTMSYDIAQHRKRKGLTQKELGDAVGVSRRTIQDYEGGRRQPKPMVVDLIKRALGAENVPTETHSKGASVAVRVDDEKSGKPFYDVDFQAGYELFLDEPSTRPSFHIDYQPYNHCDLWVRVSGKSMSPFISNGDIAALKKVEGWQDFLLSGEIYAVVANNGLRTIKKVRVEKDNFILIPHNKSEEFSIDELPRKMVRSVWQVLGVIKHLS